jgi:hypothetical protein
VSWVLDADIRGFFDAMAHSWIIRFLEHRIGDERILRLIGKNGSRSAMSKMDAEHAAYVAHQGAGPGAFALALVGRQRGH